MSSCTQCASRLAGSLRATEKQSIPSSQSYESINSVQQVLVALLPYTSAFLVSDLHPFPDFLHFR